MKLVLIIICFFIACNTDSPRTIGDQNPYEVFVPKNQMVLVDMGYVKGTINDKRIHAYRVAYENGLGISNDHLYILENSDQISITQPEGKTNKHVSVIIDNDTFEVKK